MRFLIDSYDAEWQEEPQETEAEAEAEADLGMHNRPWKEAMLPPCLLLTWSTQPRTLHLLRWLAKCRQTKMRTPRFTPLECQQHPKPRLLHRPAMSC